MPTDPAERLALARRKAEGAIEGAPPPADDHPIMLQSGAVRDALAAEGLPTQAEGVQVHLLGEPNPWDPQGYHGSNVARSVAGPVGLGQGAEVFLHDPLPWELEGEEAIGRQMAIDEGTAGLADALTWSVDRADRMLDRTADELERLRQDAPASDQVRISSMSYGTSPVRLANEAAHGAVMAHIAGEASPLVADVNALLKERGQPEIDLDSVNDRRRFPAVLAELFAQEWEQPEAQARLNAGRERLTEEVARAREANIYPLISAGNDGVPEEVYRSIEENAGPEARAAVEAQHRGILAGIPGFRMVGATGVGATPSSSDDPIADFSSPGATIASLGDDIPVAAPNPLAVFGGAATNEALETDGTSFSTPYTGGVIALMVAANPEITPDQIDQILDQTARNDPNTTRDGQGILDEVAAVRAARALATP